MEKYYNEEGKVGVIFSPGHGAGWSTWNYENTDELIFDKTLVEAVLKKDYKQIEIIANNLCHDGCFLSVSQLVVEFLEPGTTFQINEYDGYESLVVYDPGHYFVA